MGIKNVITWQPMAQILPSLVLTILTFNFFKTFIKYMGYLKGKCNRTYLSRLR